jgi:hypothetical protein
LDVEAIVDKLDIGHRGLVAFPKTTLEHSSVSTGPLSVTRDQGLEELVCDRGLSEKGVDLET